jgi:chemotaxis protein MotB
MVGIEMGKRSRVKHENHERWLVSYADFVTLLFALFVVMFAHSSVDRSKLQRFAQRFGAYINPSGAARPAPQAAPDVKEPIEDFAAAHEALTLAEMRDSIETLKQDLLPEIQQGKIELSLQPRGLVMSLRESGFFAPGETQMQPESAQIMRKVAEALTRIPGEIRLEGHTDTTPIRTARFPSNWRLSSARAIAVLNLLTLEYGISPARVAASGYGEYRPLVANDAPGNRAINRRVDVVILTKSAAEMEPALAPAIAASSASTN